MFPKSNHETFSQKLYQTFKDHRRFIKPKLTRSDFTVVHYAGEVSLIIYSAVLFNFLCVGCCWSIFTLWTSFQVQYQSDQFLDKNKDYVVAEHQNLLSSSSCSFVAGLFPSLSDEGAKSSKFSSIGSRFKVSSFLSSSLQLWWFYLKWVTVIGRKTIYQVLQYIINNSCSDLIGAATVATVDGYTKFHRAPLH